MSSNCQKDLFSYLTLFKRYMGNKITSPSFGCRGVQVLGQGVQISGQGVPVSGQGVLLIQYDGQVFCITLIASALCNIRLFFTADWKGTLWFVRRQLWMWERESNSTITNIVSDRQTDKNLTDIANMNNRQTDKIVLTSHGVLVMK